MEHSPQGIGHDTKPAGAEEAFGTCSQAHGVSLGAVLCIFGDSVMETML